MVKANNSSDLVSQQNVNSGFMLDNERKCGNYQIPLITRKKNNLYNWCFQHNQKKTTYIIGVFNM